MKRILLLSLLSLPLLVAQSTTPLQPANPFVNQFVGAGIGYDQNAAPQQIFGGMVYAKLLSAAAGTYSYTTVSETSINLHPKFAVQTSTQTGGCVYLTSFSSWNVFTCAQVGIALSGGTAGPAAAGTILAMKPLGTKGWQVALAGGPSYAGSSGGSVSYPIGVIFGFGSK